jgi:hypothetical protein
LEDDWNHGILFELQDNSGYPFTLTKDPHSSYFDGRYALVVGSFATAYRLLEEVIFNRFSLGLNIEVPQTSIVQFEPIIIADMHKVEAQYYVPDMKLYEQIQNHLCSGLLDPDGEIEGGGWSRLLEDSGCELNRMDNSKVFNYVMDEVKKRRMDFIHITGIMWLGDIYERGQSVD